MGLELDLSTLSLTPVSTTLSRQFLATIQVGRARGTADRRSKRKVGLLTALAIGACLERA